MATKIITLDDHFSTGEPTVQLVSTWGRHGLLREATSLHKIASTRSPALDYIRTVEPEKGKSIVLVVGLGDHETYGANRNGDGFPSEPVRNKIAADEVLTKHYQSYDKAHVFEHHANSDPRKAIGRVKKAFWNPGMRRVELVEDFDHAKAPHLLEKIASGEYPAKSMGARIKYDVCTNCGNKAKTRAEYCDHLKYAMSRIDPESGIQNAALNPSPQFFDSSWVIRPADRTGYMLKKVAKENVWDIKMSSFELGEQVDDLAYKAAELGKAADIEKLLTGEPVGAVSSLGEKDAKLVQKYMRECRHDDDDDDDDKPVNRSAVSIMISYKPSDALGAADAAGLPLGIKDILSYFLGKLEPGEEKKVDKDTLKSASDHLGVVYSIFHQYPRFYDDVVKEAGLMEAPRIDSQSFQKLADSLTTDYLKRKILPEDFRNPRPNTDVMSWTDPNTGSRYQTNYGTVQRTNDALVQQGLKQKAITSGSLLGASALLGGATHAMRRTAVPRAVRLGTGLTSAGLGLVGVKKLTEPTPIAGPKIVTDQGETISGWTEMMPEGRMTFAHVIKRAAEHPRPLPPQRRENILRLIKQAEVHDELSPLLGPSLDFEKVCRVLGSSILASR